MESLIRVETHDALALIALCRPEKRNALTPEMLEQLRQHLQSLAKNPTVHVLILYGEGPGFCAGADVALLERARELRDFQTFAQAEDLLQECVKLLATSPKITMAAMHGFVLGSGLDLALACDLRVAAAGTQMAASNVRLGLVPDGGATWALPRLIGLGPAMAMLLSGEPVEAEGAYRLGLIHKRVHAGKHLQEAAAWGHELARGSWAAHVAIKRLARVDPRLTLEAALKEEREAQKRLFEDGWAPQTPGRTPS
ncbi:MAG: enoyl-CoA hydratase/isomerase family protein [Thermoanaerobaculum sp.]|nr:enoyl-CoA hydratase/isomerase family protein [Thermoanaerobaculum sp.]